MTGHGSRPTRSLITDPGFAASLFKGQAAAMVMSDEARAASLAATLAAHPRPGAHGGDVFVFACGSLMWNPFIETIDRVPARTVGYRRSLCLSSDVGRGTAELPGLMFGMEPGGSAVGFALRIAADKVAHELEVLWRLEMISNAYAPRWLAIRMGGERAHAVAFVIKAHPRYAGGLDFATVVERVATARGSFGTCYEYVSRAHEALAAAGMRDRPLEQVVTAARARMAALAAGGGDAAAIGAPRQSLSQPLPRPGDET